MFKLENDFIYSADKDQSMKYQIVNVTTRRQVLSNAIGRVQVNSDDPLMLLPEAHLCLVAYITERHR